MKLKSTFIIFSVIGLFLGIAILAISFFRVPRQDIKGIKEIKAQEKEVEHLQKQASKQSDYTLAYPGILPDHPLYWLKMVRDRVQLILSRNQIEKTKLLLLYADKRAAAAEKLLQKNKEQLAITTFTKAEKYLERTFLNAEKIENHNIKKTLEKALAKHWEVQQNFENNMSEELYQRLKIRHQRLEKKAQNW